MRMKPHLHLSHTYSCQIISNVESWFTIDTIHHGPCCCCREYWLCIAPKCKKRVSLTSHHHETSSFVVEDGRSNNAMQRTAHTHAERTHASFPMFWFIWTQFRGKHKRTSNVVRMKKKNARKKLGTDIWNDYCVHCFDSNPNTRIRTHTHSAHNGRSRCACIAYKFHREMEPSSKSRSYELIISSVIYELILSFLWPGAQCVAARISFVSSIVVVIGAKQFSLFAFTLISPLTRWWTFGFSEDYVSRVLFVSVATAAVANIRCILAVVNQIGVAQFAQLRQKLISVTDHRASIHHSLPLSSPLELAIFGSRREIWI